MYVYLCLSLFLYLNVDADKRLAVTKVVTLRDFEHNDPLPPPEKWVKCFRVADCLQELSTNVMQEWELPDTDHVLLDIVEAHCYFVDIGRIDREQIRSRINNNDCRTFRPRRPLSTAYRTKETAV